MFRIYYIIWELPQFLIGFILYHILFLNKKVIRVNKENNNYIVIVSCNLNVSFGLIVFLSNQSTKTTEKHELGHSKQSRILGWLYLPLVGIPSVTLNILCRLGIVDPRNYYKYYPESWADALGGVKRYAARTDRTV